MTKWYRFDSTLVSNGCDEWGESTGSHVEVYLHTYEVIKKTPKGAWLKTSFDKRGTFVLDDGPGRRFASPTIEAAAERFRQRKKRRIQILTAALSREHEATRVLECRLKLGHYQR